MSGRRFQRTRRGGLVQFAGVASRGAPRDRSTLTRVEILIDAGGSTHRLAEDLAVVLADNPRAFPRDPEHSRRAADKPERALVDAA